MDTWASVSGRRECSGGQGARRLRWWLLPASLLLSACERPAVLRPQGPAAAQIANDWWLLFWVAVAVVLIVFAVFSLALLRRRRGSADQAGMEHRAEALVLYGGGLVPLLILAAVTVFIVASLARFDTQASADALNVSITGHMFWWEIEYPDDGVVTANELHIPVGRDVRIDLDSADVIHSFWVPQLHGKLELIPGRTNTITLRAEAPGSYDGLCAEFCGAQHANMRLVVIAQMPEDYEAWMDGQREPAPEPASELAASGAQVFGQLICANCHTVRGVSEAMVEAGPDLTHLASRGTLAARTVPNTQEQLRAWILDPQAIKPGNMMPATSLDAEQLDALLAFLGSLR